jgi:hypothetical protein
MTESVPGLLAAWFENPGDDFARDLLADALEEQGLGAVSVQYAVEAPARDLLAAAQAVVGDVDWDFLRRGGSMTDWDGSTTTNRENSLWGAAARFALLVTGEEPDPAGAACWLWERCARDGSPHLDRRGGEILRAVFEWGYTGGASGMDPARPWYGLAAADVARLRRWAAPFVTTATAVAHAAAD